MAWSISICSRASHLILNFAIGTLFLTQVGLYVKVGAEGLFETEPEVYLTVSSEPDCPLRRWFKPWTWFTETKCDRRLELNWINFDKVLPQLEDLEQVEDYIGLFRWDPVAPTAPQPPPSPPVDHKYVVKSRTRASSGYYKTTARYEGSVSNQRRTALSPGGAELMKNPCYLGYWIAYVRTRMIRDDNGTRTETIVLKSNCLRIYPFWMSELKESIGDLPLTSLMIPGTHNSGSWEKYRGLLKSEINPVAAYEITQEESIYDQLIYGIRYLDVRITHHPFLPRDDKSNKGNDTGSGEMFWISHDSLLPQLSLTTMLKDLQRFQEETGGKEIVFVDFHQVTIHTKERTNQSEQQQRIHSQLIQLVDKHLGRYLVPNDREPESLTPNRLWNLTKTVFVTYPDPTIRKQYSFLWPPFQHSWADTNNITLLENYLNQDLQMFGCRGRFWTLMTELTATFHDIITKPHVGLRGMAQAVNGPVTSWLRRKEWYSRTMTVASDYFLGNNLIEMAIKVNRNRAVCT